MGMRTYASSAWEIPASVLEKNFSEDYNFLIENESEFTDWLQDGEVDEELATRFKAITDSFKAWCAEKNLSVAFDYRGLDDDNDPMNQWMIVCENAVTINPAFKDLGGDLVHWTVFC